MSAIAAVLAGRGHQVTGSDRADGPVVRRLRDLGVEVSVGAGAELAAAADLVAASTAVTEDDLDIAAARAAGVTVVRRTELLPALCEGARTVVVSGTHGKTTTSAMLLCILRSAGLDPSGIVGGDVAGLGGGGVAGAGAWFVLEGDESDGSFLGPDAEVAVVTSVEADHLDHHGSEAALDEAFRRFLGQARGARIVCADDEGAMRAAAGLDRVVTYGTTDAAALRLVDPELTADGSRFRVQGPGGVELARVELAQPGLHHALDAVAALAAAAEAGVPFDVGAAALADFGGVARRLERRGEAGGVTFVDSYAHLPTEVAGDIAAVRPGPWRRRVVVFQPHRFTRTAALGHQFGDAFEGADLVVITGLYAAGQEPIEGVSAKRVVDAVLDRHPWRRVAWLPTLADVERYLLVTLRPGDLCLTLGAGDLTGVPDRVRDALATRTGTRGTP